MADIATDLLLASSAADGGGGGPTGPYDGVALSQENGSNQVRAYKLTHGVGWGAAVTSPTFGSTTIRDMDFNQATGNSVVFGANVVGDGYLQAYAWSNSTGFGSRYSNPSTNNLSSTYSLKFTNSGSHVITTFNSGKNISAFAWDDATGFGTRSEPSSAMPSFGTTDYSLAISSDDLAVFANTSTSPYITAYVFSPVTGWGSRYPNPASSVAGYVRGIGVHPSNNAVALAHSTPPYLTVYAWDHATGFGAKYSNPSPSISTANGLDAQFTKTGSAIIFGGSTLRRAWAWDSATGFGVAYSDPTAYTNEADRVYVANTNDIIYIAGSTFTDNMVAYEWDDTTGWGTYYSSPLGGWNGLGPGALSKSS